MRVPTLALLLLTVALAGCGGNEKDSDRDGLTDRFERGGWLVRVDYLRERVEYRSTSDTGTDDSDGDGLTDSEEFLLGIDPSLADTDRDGLSDCQEERHTNRTECETPPEGVAADGGYGTDPKRADSDPGSGRFVRREGWFTDTTGTLHAGPETGDGISDGEEVNGYLVTVPGGQRMVRTDPRDADDDNDGLGDGEEREYLGDPKVPDTDGDGCDDGGDPFPAFEEFLRPGLLDFTLDPRVASAEVRFHVLVGGAAIVIPPGGALVAEGGKRLDLSAYGDVGVRPASCTFPPYAATMEVIVTVQDVPATNPRSLDVSSLNPAKADRIRWDPVHHELVWPDGEDISGDPTFRGLDGTLRLRPANPA